MKKTTLINSELSYVIAKLGHTQMLTVADAGLPIPKEVPRIDLALTEGIPSFVEVIDAVSSEMEIEQVILAEECLTESNALYKQLELRFGLKKIILMSHEDLKKMSSESVAIVRTGEMSPYANAILVSGVSFGNEKE